MQAAQCLVVARGDLRCIFLQPTDRIWTQGTFWCSDLDIPVLAQGRRLLQEEPGGKVLGEAKRRADGVR